MAPAPIVFKKLRRVIPTNVEMKKAGSWLPPVRAQMSLLAELSISLVFAFYKYVAPDGALLFDII